VRPDAGISRHEVIQHLESRQIATRLLFGGNLVRQPLYQEVEYRQIGDLPNADFVMQYVFWVGNYPGLSEEQIQFMIESFHSIPH
jgi:CDP-6-deoxy-D-xylo-4-hexulose-3-dehydrase